MHSIQGTGLMTGPIALRNKQGNLIHGTRTHVWADDGFGNMVIVDRHTAYNSMLPQGHVASGKVMLVIH